MAICRGTAVLATVCVAPFFNAAAFTAALGLGFVSVFYSLKDARYDMHDFFKSKLAGEKFVSRPRMDPVPDGSFVADRVERFRTLMNIRRPVQACVMNDEYLFRTMNWFERKLAECDPDRLVQKKSYFAYTHSAKVALTPDSINRTALEPDQKQELEFILAHEVAHIKTRDQSYSILKHVMNSTALYLAGMIVARPVLALFGVDLPVTENIINSSPLISSCVSLSIVFQTAVFANVALNKVSRTAEARADRNALYATRNLDAAKDALIGVGVSRFRAPLAIQWLSTHPLGADRLASLDKAWIEIQEFEKRHGCNTPSAPAP